MLANELGRRGIAAGAGRPEARHHASSRGQRHPGAHHGAFPAPGLRRRSARARPAARLPDRHRLLHPLRAPRARPLRAALRARRASRHRPSPARGAPPSCRTAAPEVRRAGAAAARRGPAGRLGAFRLADDALSRTGRRVSDRWLEPTASAQRSKPTISSAPTAPRSPVRQALGIRYGGETGVSARSWADACTRSTARCRTSTAWCRTGRRG